MLFESNPIFVRKGFFFFVSDPFFVQPLHSNFENTLIIETATSEVLQAGCEFNNPVSSGRRTSSRSLAAACVVFFVVVDKLRPVTRRTTFAFSVAKRPNAVFRFATNEQLEDEKLFLFCSSDFAFFRLSLCRTHAELRLTSTNFWARFECVCSSFLSCVDFLRPSG